MLKFFLNAKEEYHLCGLEKEFSVYNNTKPLLLPNIHSVLLKHLGFDEIIKKVVNKLGELKKVYLVRKLTQGIDFDKIDLIFIGSKINKNYLLELLEKTRKNIKLNISYIVFSTKEIQII